MINKRNLKDIATSIVGAGIIVFYSACGDINNKENFSSNNKDLTATQNEVYDPVKNNIQNMYSELYGEKRKLDLDRGSVIATRREISKNEKRLEEELKNPKSIKDFLSKEVKSRGYAFLNKRQGHIIVYGPGYSSGPGFSRDDRKIYSANSEEDIKKILEENYPESVKILTPEKQFNDYKTWTKNLSDNLKRDKKNIFSLKEEVEKNKEKYQIIQNQMDSLENVFEKKYPDEEIIL